MPKASKKCVAPGSIVILLTGKYAGTRVVALKEISESRIVICGPHNINRCPIMTIPKSRVIVTSAKIDLPAISGLDNIEDKLFSLSKAKEVIPEISELNNKIYEIVKGNPDMCAYMKSKFSLNKTFRIPLHELKF